MMDWSSRKINTNEHEWIFLKIFSLQRGAPRESDTASPTRGGVLVEHVVCSCTVGHITA